MRRCIFRNESSNLAKKPKQPVSSTSFRSPHSLHLLHHPPHHPLSVTTQQAFAKRNTLVSLARCACTVPSTYNDTFRSPELWQRDSGWNTNPASSSPSHCTNTHHVVCSTTRCLCPTARSWSNIWGCYHRTGSRSRG